MTQEPGMFERLQREIAMMSEENRVQEARYAEAIRVLRAARDKGHAGARELWLAADRICGAEPHLHAFGGYRSCRAFLAGELPGIPRRSVERRRLVVRSFAEADCERHPWTLLEELALYAAGRGLVGPDGRVDLDLLVVRVPRRRGVAVVPARESTVAEVRAARALGSGKPRRSIGPAERAIRDALRRHRSLRSVTVRVAGGSVSFAAVPLPALRDLGAAIARASRELAARPR